mmetsp:Transcript_18786/g.45372  ORF Transcript_18786/g.45372 Transcript_18786/m.45372 type:complete len:686 (+) Transcript_18786:152-2209(+)
MEDQCEVQIVATSNNKGGDGGIAGAGTTSISMSSSTLSLSPSSHSAAPAPPVDEFKVIAIDHIKKKNDLFWSPSPKFNGRRAGLKGGFKKGGSGGDGGGDGGGQVIKNDDGYHHPNFDHRPPKKGGGRRKSGPTAKKSTSAAMAAVNTPQHQEPQSRNHNNSNSNAGAIEKQSRHNDSSRISGLTSTGFDDNPNPAPRGHGMPYHQGASSLLPNQISLRQRQHQPPPSSAPTTTFATETQAGTTASSQQQQDDAKFELMSVRLTMYGLSGIICEQVKTKKKRFSAGSAGGNGGGGRRNRHKNQNRNGISHHIGELSHKPGNGNASTAGSTISSLSSVGDIASRQSENTIGQVLMNKSTPPTTAVVSCEKNAVGSQTSLQTYLPSMPLNQPASVFANKASFSASWPLEKLAVVDTTKEAESNKTLSSFQMIRCMQSAGFTSGNSGVVAGTSFKTQHIELQINLSRGTDIFSIGTARVAFCGDEETETVIHVPVHGLEQKLKKRFGKLGGKNKKKQRRRFESDPNLNWSLEDNATIKVGIQVIPQKTLEFREEMDTLKKEDELRQLLQQDDIATLLRRMGSNSDRLGEHAEKVIMKKEEPTPVVEEAPKVEQKDPVITSSFAGILCGALPSSFSSFCVGSSTKVPSEPARIPAVVGGNNNQVLSILSSVSESTDGFTQHDDDEDGEG